MFAVYLTHPQVRIDPDIPVPQWGLSEIGRQRTFLTAQAAWLGRIERIISSDERKATETAEILGDARGIAPETGEAMGENDRSATGFLAPPAFEKAADWFFAHPHESFHGWERAADAQTRIVGAIDRVLASHAKDRPVLFIGHGGVGTLLKLHLSGLPISRDRDQPPGGGNLFAFDLETRRLLCDWTAMETWRGPASAD